LNNCVLILPFLYFKKDNCKANNIFIKSISKKILRTF
jgi:hypothetical protein